MAVTVTAIPGPAVVLTIKNSLRYGYKASIVNIFGNFTAMIILAALSALGLGAIILASSTLFASVKILGCLYLVYLGVKVWRTPHSSKKNFEIFDTEEFIATITQHIPDKSFQLVRYYGWYSNRSRGDRRKNGLLKQKETVDSDTGVTNVLNISEPKQKKIPSKTWSECIKKVWEVDPLECPKCGSEMKIISFIDEQLLIQHILKPLNLWQERITRGLPPPEEAIAEIIVCEELDDGWGSYGDPDVTMH